MTPHVRCAGMSPESFETLDLLPCARLAIFSITAWAVAERGGVFAGLAAAEDLENSAEPNL